jgi:O-antigen/teichoic acid export membrane protein
MSDSGRVSRTRSVLSNWAGYIFAAVVSFVLSPFVVHSLGNSAYGIWTILGSLVGYMGLLDLGVRAAVTRYVARFHALRDHSEATWIVSTALAIFGVIGLLVTAVAGGLAFFVADLFKIPEDLVSDAQVVLLLGGVNMAVSLIGGVYGGVVIGLQRFDLSNIAEIAIGAVRALAIVLALKAGYGLIALGVIQLGVSGLRALASYILSRRLYPELRASVLEYRRSHLTMIFSFSSSVFLLQASGMLILFSDSVVIGALLPVSMVTFFAIAATLTEYARAPISGISQTLNPSASVLEAEDEGDELKRVLLTGSRIATLIALPIILTFMIRGQSFIGLWMGEEYAEPSGDVLWVLSLALWFAVGYQIVVATMVGISKHSGIVPAFVIEGLSNITLSLIWIQSFGIIGVAWGTTVPRLISSTIFCPWYVQRVMGIPFSHFWFTVWVKPAIAMVPFASGSWLIDKYWPADNLFQYFSQVAIMLPLAALGAWLFSLTPAEKRRLAPPGFFGRLVSKKAGC